MMIAFSVSYIELQSGRSNGIFIEAALNEIDAEQQARLYAREPITIVAIENMTEDQY